MTGGWRLPGWRRLPACDPGQQRKGCFFALRPEFAVLMHWVKGKEGEETLQRVSTEVAGPEVSTHSEVVGDSSCRVPLVGGRADSVIS